MVRRTLKTDEKLEVVGIILTKDFLFSFFFLKANKKRKKLLNELIFNEY